MLIKKIFYLLLINFIVFATDITNTSDNASKTITNNIYGSHLFSGNFSNSTKHIYNPDYQIAIGDSINIKLWGAIELVQQSIVDSQGNIFIPQVGVIHLLGVSNKDLAPIIQNKIKQTYKSNVYAYADLDSYQTIPVFVTGNVNKPGLYEGLSSDSLIQYIDKAGGINLEYGSFRNIEILRNNKVINKIDLYDFLLNGKISYDIFKSGDVILVHPINGYVNVIGEVRKPFRFELSNDLKTLEDLAKLANAKSTTTNAIVRSYDNNNKLQVSTYSIGEFKNVLIKSGDEIEFKPDYTTDNIKINIEGEHDGLHSLVVAKGTTLQDVVNKLFINDRSDLDSIQVYRKSVAKLQKKLLDTQLKELESLALTTSSSTLDEAKIKESWSNNILNFIQRAKEIEPKGQIVIDNSDLYASIILEEDDVINIPAKDNLIVLQGEISIPSAFIYQEKLKLKDYIKMAGGLNSKADKEKILLIHKNGKVDKISIGLFGNSKIKINAGDSILVLPKVETYNLQITGLLSQILYHIAVATKVVLDI